MFLNNFIPLTLNTFPKSQSISHLSFFLFFGNLFSLSRFICRTSFLSNSCQYLFFEHIIQLSFIEVRNIEQALISSSKISNCEECHVLNNVTNVLTSNILKTKFSIIRNYCIFNILKSHLSKRKFCMVWRICLIISSTNLFKQAFCVISSRASCEEGFNKVYQIRE